jgi:DNA-binding Lrp family transcriptional regulator
MSDLDTEIQKLKAAGKSLREIASVLGISHEAVRKRLKNLEGKVSTNEVERKLTASPVEKERATVSNAHKTKASAQPRHTVNQVSTSNTPSHIPAEGVNPLETPSDELSECKKGVFQGVDSESGDLFERVKVFLEAIGIEVYRMQVSGEAYQVKHNGQAIRFYVDRNRVERPNPPG